MGHWYYQFTFNLCILMGVYPAITTIFTLTIATMLILLKMYAWYSRTTMKRFSVGVMTGFYSVLTATAESFRKEESSEEQTDPIDEIQNMYVTGEIQNEYELEQMLENELNEKESKKSSEVKIKQL